MRNYGDGLSGNLSQVFAWDKTAFPLHYYSHYPVSISFSAFMPSFTVRDMHDPGTAGWITVWSNSNIVTVTQLITKLTSLTFSLQCAGM